MWLLGISTPVPLSKLGLLPCGPLCAKFGMVSVGELGKEKNGPGQSWAWASFLFPFSSVCCSVVCCLLFVVACCLLLVSSVVSCVVIYLHEFFHVHVCQLKPSFKVRVVDIQVLDQGSDGLCVHSHCSQQHDLAFGCQLWAASNYMKTKYGSSVSDLC